MTARSYLYVPGHRPDRFAKALASGTDAVILDLEDAVPVPAKDTAREDVATFLAGLATAAVETWVRINDGDRGRDDLAALAGIGALAGVIVPKSTTDVIAERHAQALAQAPSRTGGKTTDNPVAGRIHHSHRPAVVPEHGRDVVACDGDGTGTAHVVRNDGAVAMQATYRLR